MFKNQLGIAIRFTIITAILLGVGYPFAVTGFAHLTMRDKADGQLISQNGHVIGSRILSQGFTTDKYFHPRPSAAGNGYDAANSGGTNFGPTNQKLIDRVKADTERLQGENPGAPVPVELVTTSASGLDPELSPAGAEFQVPRIAHERGLSEEQVRAIIAKYSSPRQLGYLGEARVNVLEVNLALDAAKAMAH